MDLDGTGRGTVVTDVAAVGRLDGALAEIGGVVAGIGREWQAVLDEIRVAAGTDQAAAVFRPRLAEIGGAASSAIDAISAGLDAHRESLRRGVHTLVAADADARDAIARGR